MMPLTEEGRKRISEASKHSKTKFKKGHILSVESRLKLSQSLKGKTAWNKGLTKETDPRVKEAWNRGKKNVYSAETLNKIGSAMRGKHHTAEARKRIAQASLGRHHTLEAKLKVSLANKGRKFSTEHRRKLSDAKQGYIPWNKGKTNVYSAETRKKISDSGKGKHYHSLATRAKLSKALQGRVSGMKGKHHTAEARKKIAQVWKGRHHTVETRRKMALNNPRIWKGKKLSPEHRTNISKAFTPERRNLQRINRLKQKMPLKDTKIELQTFAILDELHIKYERHYPILNTTQADAAILKSKVAIFPDGCYWHHCPLCTSNKITSNTSFQFKGELETRLIERAKRDREITSILQANGWYVIRIWEHEYKNVEQVKLKLINELIIANNTKESRMIQR